MTNQAKSLLIVDDDPDIVALISFLLRDQPLTFFRGKDGIDAFMSVSLHGPSQVLIDLCLPGITGLEVIQQLRRDPNLNMTITAMSADPGLLDRALAEGADAILAKPFERRDLMRVLAAMGANGC